MDFSGDFLRVSYSDPGNFLGAAQVFVGVPRKRSLRSK